MTNITLTAKETAILAAAAAVSMNYDTAEAEKADNATIFTVEELANETGTTYNSAKGVAGSLFKKGLFCETEEPNTGNTAMSLTDEGIDAYYAYAMPKADDADTPAEAGVPAAAVLFWDDAAKVWNFAITDENGVGLRAFPVEKKRPDMEKVAYAACREAGLDHFILTNKPGTQYKKRVKAAA